MLHQCHETSLFSDSPKERRTTVILFFFNVWLVDLVLKDGYRTCPLSRLKFWSRHITLGSWDQASGNFLPLLDETPMRGLSHAVPQPRKAGNYRNNCNDESKEDVAWLEPGTADGDSGLQGKTMSPSSTVPGPEHPPDALLPHSHELRKTWP